jgi:DNA transposition AAA+ family ATPase
MTNTEKLNKYIEASGLKKSYIAKVLGVVDSTLARKINNAQDFKASEIEALCRLLNIESLEEKEAIFFAQEVAGTATA